MFRYGRWFSDAPADRPTCKPVVCGQPSIGHGSLATGDAVRYKVRTWWSHDHMMTCWLFYTWWHVTCWPYSDQAGGAAVVICDEGYQLRQSSNNKLVCRSVNIGVWSEHKFLLAERTAAGDPVLGLSSLSALRRAVSMTTLWSSLRKMETWR